MTNFFLTLHIAKNKIVENIVEKIFREVIFMLRQFLKIFAVTFFVFGILSFTPAEAKPVEVSPHIFVDTVPEKNWYLNDNKDVIFVGYGSPLFPKKKTHYLDYKSIKFGTLKDGRFIITCNYYGLYEFAVFYTDKKDDGSQTARFMIRATVDSNASPHEVDSVLGDYNGLNLKPFPPARTNPIVYRTAEMLYYLVKGEKFFGDLNPADYLEGDQDILNPYTQDLYDRCTRSSK